MTGGPLNRWGSVLLAIGNHLPNQQTTEGGDNYEVDSEYTVLNLGLGQILGITLNV